MQLSWDDFDRLAEAYTGMQSGMYLLQLLEEDARVEADESFAPQINATTRGYVIEGLVARLQDMSAVLDRLQTD